MAEIYVPGAIDIMGSANQMMQFRNSQQAQQANALQMQYTMEDRAREAENRKIAAGNARAEQARKQQFISTIQSGYTPAKTAVMGPGTIQGNTPASFDPEKVKNELLRLGDLSGLVTFSNAQEQLATQKKVEAEATGQGLINEETRAKTTGTDYENIKKYIDLTRSQIDAAPDIASLKAVVAATFTPGHPMAKFNELNGLTLEQSMAAIDGLLEKGYTFPQIREQMSQGATKAADNIATRGSAEAAARSSDAAATSSLATAAKTKYEMDNPGFTIESVQTAAGPIRVRVDKKTGVLTPLTLDGKTVAPEVTPIAPTQLEQLQNLEAKLRAADPNDRRLIDVRNAIEKETTKTPGVTVNTGDTAGQTYEKKGSELIVANYASLSDVPQQLENFRKVKELIPQAVKFMGKGGTTYADAVSFLNNRLGTDISVKDANGNLASAREIEARLFQGILENLKKMDSQPTQAQQQALKDAIGQLQTEPDALARLVDAFSEPFIAKVKVHNDDVDKALKRGDVRAEDYRIKLPETTDSAPKKFKWNASTGLMEQQ
jgi:hypothetical protein